LLASSVGEPVALYFEELERRVALLEKMTEPLPEPDPLVVGTEVFRQQMKVKTKALRRA
jgi:hypothetical protein